MAQVDTGMGWSAASDFLVQSDATLAIFGGLLSWTISGYEPQHVPVFSNAPSTADLVTNGFLYATVFDRSGQSSVKYYIAADTPGTLVCVGKNGTDAVFLVLGRGNTKVWTTTGGTVTERAITYATGNPNISCVYWTESGYWRYGTGTYSCPTTDTAVYTAVITWALANVAETAAFNVDKSEIGYAAACIVMCNTVDGARNIPVLISTDSGLTRFSYTGSLTEELHSYLMDGVRFYMRIVVDISDPLKASSVPVIDLSSGPIVTADMIWNGVRGPSYANILIIDSPDPYEEEGGGGGEDGGDGEEPQDDPVEEETLPIPAVVGLGFSTIYVPTQTDLYNLAAYLWGGNLDLDTFLKLFANPMDSILGLSAVPLVLTGTYEPIYLGGQLLQGITLPKYTGRTAVKVDMGTATITERWGAYLDYDPYTELAVYVPFVGIKNIKADDVMGKTIRLMYDIDILSGACIAYLRPEGGSVLYEWSGQCAMQIPITGANWDNIFNSAIHTVAALGGALFAPASAPVLGGAVASAASQAIAAKPRIERSGAMNGVTGFLGQLRPYIIRTIPEAYIPNDQNKFIGYPSYVSVNLGNLTGYNEIASIHLENIPATGDELAELESVLKGGAIF